MIIGTRQKLSRFEECALSLYLDGRQLEQTQEERLLGVDIDPSLSWSSHVANLRKKLLKRVAVLARIKKSYQSSFQLMLVLNLFLSTVCPSGEVLKKIMDGCAPSYLSEKLLSLKYCKSHCIRSRLPYRLPIPRNKSMIRMFLQLRQLHTILAVCEYTVRHLPNHGKRKVEAHKLKLGK